MRRLFVPAMLLAMLWPVDGFGQPTGLQIVFGPSTFTRGRAAPRPVVHEFGAAAGTATVLVEDLGPTGALVQAWLNGVQLLREQDLSGSGRAMAEMEVSLLEQNTLMVLLAGKPGSSVRITVYGTTPSAAWKEPCEGRGALFTTPPVSTDQLRAVVPLGALDPPAVVLPAPHLSLSPRLDALGAPSEVPVRAPGRATIVAVLRRAAGSAGELSVYLQPCREVHAALLHLGRLEPELDARIGSIGHRYCPDADTCIDAVEIEVAAGTLLGYGGGAGSMPVALRVEDDRRLLGFANPGRYTIDGAPTLLSTPVPLDVLTRVLPRRLSAVCGLDSFDPAVTPALEVMLSSPDGARPRTVPPLCGEHMQDVPGSAQGNWFAGAADSALLGESGAVALVHDNVDPTVGVFSFGSALYLGPATYSFTPASVGYVNTDFALVAPGSVYCYSGLKYNGKSFGGRVFLELFSEAPGVANRLRIEHRSGACSTRPWGFSSGAQVLQR